MDLPNPSKTSTTPLLLSLLLILHFPLTIADPLYEICGSTGNYTTKSTYQTNLNHIFSSLSSNGSLSGFATATYGQVPDQVYGLTLCRGDTNSSACLSCIDTASQDILQLCPYKKDAVVWYDPCLLRYSNQRFLSSPDINSNNDVIMVNTQSISEDGPRFEQSVKDLLKSISNWAAYNSSRSFATGEMNFTQYPNIYGLAQCARDISAGQCSRCLDGIADAIAQQFARRKGARILGVWCNMRYEVYSFYDGASTLRLASPASAPPPAVPPPPPASNTTARAPVVPSVGSTGEGIGTSYYCWLLC